MPSYGAEVIGPPSRPSEQPLWDPEVQTMDPEQRRDAAARAVCATLVAKALDGRRRAVPAQARRGRDHIAERHHLARRHQPDPGHAQAGAARQRGRASRRSATTASRRCPECVRVGQSTGTTGTPTLTILTRHDLWLEYESAARNWWRNGWRPGQVVTHCHPAYMYGGGPMLGGLDRVLRRPQHVGGAARHRRDRRAGHPHLAAHPPRRADGGAQPAPVPGGRGQDGRSTSSRTAASPPSRWAGSGAGCCR